MSTSNYSPGLEGVISNTTSISYLDVDVGQILLRGYDLIELSQKLTYPEVAHTIIYGSVPTKDDTETFVSSLSKQYEIPSNIYDFFNLMPKNTNVMDAMRTGISMLAGYEDPAFLSDNSRHANLEKGIKLLAKTPSIAANAYRSLIDQPFVNPDPKLGFAENLLFMIRGSTPDHVSLESFDRVLTCYSEHEMANSTFTARVISSTFSDIYGGMVGAIASLKGPLHGGANESAMYMLLDILENGGAQNAETYLMEKMSQGFRVMGFGHRVYMRKYDPRAYYLREYIPSLATKKSDGPELLDIYRRVEEVMLRERGLYPNADYPIALILYLLDVPIPLYTPIFFAARVAGLIAHIIEQHDNNRLFRPRVNYEGERGLTLTSRDTP